MRQRTFKMIVLICGALFLVPLSGAAATIGAPLASILTTFVNGGDRAHAGAVISAIKSSPRLVEQLNDLAAAGLLKGLALAPSGAGRFQASHQGGVINLTPQFIDNQTPAGGGDEAGRSEIGERDIVFILGYMASKLRTAQDMAAAEAKMIADFRVLVATTPKGRNPDVTELLKHSQETHLQDEARAYLEGWNDELDSAMTAKGSWLNPAEAFQLLKESRNTHVVLEAALLPPDDRLTPIGTLQFLPDEHNRRAVVSVLMHANVPDFQ
jgi:hypothetical protein